jgi:hypothetical protein
VVIGNRLARASEDGWDSIRRAPGDPRSRGLCRSAAVRGERGVIANAGEAARVAAFFRGAGSWAVSTGGWSVVAPEPEALAICPRADAALQLRILQDLAAMSLERAAIADIFNWLPKAWFGVRLRARGGGAPDA